MTTSQAWVAEQLEAAGLERTGEDEQVSLRPWATVIKVPTASGPVWFKAAAPGTAFEVPLYELLARAVPERVLQPIAADAQRGWILLPDGGTPLGERVSGPDLVDPLVEALVAYGRLQRELAPLAEEMLALGVADMRPARMPARFDEALDAVGGELAERIAGLRPTVMSWCDRLARSPLPASLDHNDLHPFNILDGGRFYDWGDSVVAHPFAAMLVPLGIVQRTLDCALDDPRFVAARNAYLDVFADLAPRAELAGTLPIACHVAKIARVLTWERAVSAAREQGDPVADEWAGAPAETLATLLDESYAGRT